jgi:hypothetical protein
MFTEVIDVGMRSKSGIFSHVSTAPAEEKAAGGQNWWGDFQPVFGHYLRRSRTIRN